MSSQGSIIARTLGAFAVAQVLAIAAAAILAVFGLNLGSGNNWVGSFVAAMFAAHRFVNATGRAPNADERRVLVWLSFAIACGISVVLVGIVSLLTAGAALQIFSKAFSSLPTGALVAIVLLISALYVGVFYAAYGWYARRVEKGLASKRQPKREPGLGKL